MNAPPRDPNATAATRSATATISAAGLGAIDVANRFNTNKSPASSSTGDDSNVLEEGDREESSNITMPPLVQNNISITFPGQVGTKGQVEVIEHHSKRSYVPLGDESDRIWLSDFFSFLRKECVEVFEASSQLVKERNRYKQIFLNQVGIRCRFCAHLPYSQRGKRSCSFPQTQCRIYQSVTMMIRDHFRVCKEMPSDIRKEYDEKKAETRRGELEARQYWTDSSKRLGLVDTPFGIFYHEKTLKNDFRSMQEVYRKV